MVHMQKDTEPSSSDADEFPAYEKTNVFPKSALSVLLFLNLLADAPEQTEPYLWAWPGLQSVWPM